MNYPLKRGKVNTVKIELFKFKTVEALLASFHEFETFKNTFPALNEYVNDLIVATTKDIKQNLENSEDFQKDLALLNSLKKSNSISSEEYYFYLEQSKKYLNSSCVFIFCSDLHEDDNNDYIVFKKDPSFIEVAAALARYYYNTGYLLWEETLGGIEILFTKMLMNEVTLNEEILKSYVYLLNSIWQKPKETYKGIQTLLKNFRRPLARRGIFSSELESLNSYCSHLDSFIREKALAVAGFLAESLGTSGETGSIAWHVLVKNIGKRFITKRLAVSIIRLEKFKSLSSKKSITVSKAVLDNEMSIFNTRFEALKTLGIYDESLLKTFLEEELRREIKISEETNCFNCKNYISCSIICEFVLSKSNPISHEGPNCEVCPGRDSCVSFLSTGNKNLICSQFTMKDNSLLESVVASLSTKYNIDITKVYDTNIKSESLS